MDGEKRRRQRTTCPFTRPTTVIGLKDPVRIIPPGEAVTVKPEIGSPPSDPDVKKTATWRSLGTTFEMVGIAGTVAFVGITGSEEAEFKLVPTAFEAVTKNVCETLFGRPRMVIGLAESFA
jgi:hypothetical protein